MIIHCILNIRNCTCIIDAYDKSSFSGDYTNLLLILGLWTTKTTLSFVSIAMIHTYCISTWVLFGPRYRNLQSLKLD